MGKGLKTSASVWSQVFRRLVQQLEADPNINRVVGRDNLRSWKGVPGDRTPFAPSSSAPVVRLTPQPRDVDWYSPDLQAGTLWVQVEIAVQSLCVDDVIDLWDLIVAALQPGTPTQAGASTLELDLTALGAETGEIVFSDPAMDPRPEAEPEGYFFASGHLRLRMVRRVS